MWPHHGGHKFYLGSYRENFRNLPVPSYKAKAYQVLHVPYVVALYQECPNWSPGVKFGPTLGVTIFRWAHTGENFTNLPVPSHKA